MHSVARVFALVLTLSLAASMVVFGFISLPEGDPALDMIGDHPWVKEARTLNRGIDPSLPAPVRYFIWLGRVLGRVRVALGALRSDHLTS